MSDPLKELNDAYAAKFRRFQGEQKGEEVAGFIAAYPGRCSRCDKRFRKGTWIRKADKYNEYEHVDCENAVDEAPTLEAEEAEYDAQFGDPDQYGHKPSGVCARCFLVHKGECP